MQIVIDISEREYNKLMSRFIDEHTIFLPYECAIRKGTPISKGHGRLIDADATIIHVRDEEATPIYPYILKILNNAPTILEADKESEDKE